HARSRRVHSRCDETQSQKLSRLQPGRNDFEPLGSRTRSNESLFDCGNCSRRRSRDRKSTRLNSSHVAISYAVFCLKKKKTPTNRLTSGITSASRISAPLGLLL